MIDVQQVRELIELMVQHDLSEIRVREGETVISLRKGATGEIACAAPQMVLPAASSVAVGAPQAASPVAPAPAADEGLVPIVSPMVGTLYVAGDPDTPAFVHVGSEIDANSPVCIIEAMKVFNEIKAEVAGTVERILVQNEQAVEFNQPIMLVRPRK